MLRQYQLWVKMTSPPDGSLPLVRGPYSISALLLACPPPPLDPSRCILLCPPALPHPPVLPWPSALPPLLGNTGGATRLQPHRTDVRPSAPTIGSDHRLRPSFDPNTLSGSGAPDTCTLLSGVDCTSWVPSRPAQVAGDDASWLFGVPQLIRLTEKAPAYELETAAGFM